MNFPYFLVESKSIMQSTRLTVSTEMKNNEVIIDSIASTSKIELAIIFHHSNRSLPTVANTQIH